MIFMQLDWTPLWISIKTSFVATGIAFILGILLARWTVFQGRKGNTLLDGILILPMVLPPTVVGFILLLLFGKNGFIGQILLKLGTTVIFSWPATVIAATVVALPLMYTTTKGAFEQINTEVIDAARTLGVREWKIFISLILPLSWPGVAAGTILSFARALGEFGATLMLAGNIPGRTQTIPIAIYFAVEGGDMFQAKVWVGVIIAISFGFVLLLSRTGGR
jgi:molybdate transport system permease protein